MRYQASEVGLGDFLTPAQAEEKMQPLNFDQRQTSAYIDSLRVEIDDDGVGEATGAIKVTLLPETGSLRTYRVPTDGRQDTEVTIWDNDVPELTIIAAETWQTEGNHAKADFKVKARFSPNKILNVRMTPTESGDFIGGTTFVHNILAPVRLDFRNDKTEVSLAVDIASDDDPEPNGSITITLEDEATLGDSYTVGTPSDATVMIRDDDSLPLLTIADLADPVLEDSGPVMFVVTSSKSGPLNVHYIASEETGDFLDESIPTPHQAEERDQDLNFTRTLTSDPFTDILEVDIHNDLVKESTGAIKVTLLAEASTSQTYIVPTDGREEAMATIWDNEVPELTLSVNETAETEAPSTTADFIVTASFSPNSNLTVFFTPTETGNFIGGRYFHNSKTSHPLDFRTGKTTVPLPIDIASDTSTESNGSITVTLEDDNPVGNSYTVGTEDDATITIIDDDSLPVLSIADLPGPVEEDSTIDFVINSSIMPAGGTLNVHYQATEMTGNFLDETTSPSQAAELDQNLTFSQSSPFEATLEVDIHDDQDGEITGVIKVTLLTEDTLSDQPTGAQTYLVNSNEKETEATIWDDEVPELTIEAAETAETEDVSVKADFTITARFTPNSNLTIHFTPTDGAGSFIGGRFTKNTPTSDSFDFTSGKTTATLSIDIASDADVEGHGAITVTLNNENTPGTTYSVRLSEAATVRVVDDDSLPVLTIAAPTEPAIESAGMVDFTISSINNPGPSLTVRFDPSEVTPGDFLDESATPTSQTEITSKQILFTGSGGSFTATLPVPIDNDGDGERTGQIQVELLSDDAIGQTYRIDTNNTNTVIATILDDDAPELKIIAGAEVTEGPGVKASFTVSSQVPIPTANNPLTVHYTPESADFMETGSRSPTSKSLNFTGSAPGPYTAPLEIDVHDDDDAENDGSIMVTLNEEQTPASTYTVITPDPTTPENTASVSVRDDDSVPLLTISAPSVPVPESTGSVDFIVTATGNPGDNFRVRYNVSEVSGGDFLNESATPRSQEGDMDKQINFVDAGNGTSTAPLNVLIFNDSIHERTGSIQVTLSADDMTPKTYKLEPNSPGFFARAKILDDDAPELTITAGTLVTEGIDANAIFTVTSAVPVNGNSLTVNYTPVSTNFLESGSGTPVPKLINFTGSAPGPYMAPLEIEIHDDNQIETNGSIMVTLNEESTPGTTYTVADHPKNSAEVDVNDDDSLPLMKITAPTSPVNESDSEVSFTITATVPPSITNTPGDDFPIRYDPSEVSGGDFLDSNPTNDQESISLKEIDFSGSGNTFTATLVVPIHNDMAGERTGKIQVSLLTVSPATYRIPTNGTQTVMVTIWDDDAPELKITGDGPVTEGTATHASFTITSEVAVTSLTLNYTPESVNFLESGSGIPTSTQNPLPFSTESPYITKLLIPLRDNNLPDPAGSIRVTLNEESPPADSYTVAGLPDNSAVVNVTDDESLPVLTITAPTTGTAESAGAVNFVVNATRNLGTNFRVRYDPSEVSSNFLNENATPVSQEEPNESMVDFSGSGNTYTATLSVPIDNDIIGERTGQIQVELLSDDAGAQTYKVGNDGTQMAMATIWDNDAPELKITGGSRITEGPNVDARFTVSSAVEVISLTVRYTPVSTNYLQSSGSPTTTTLNFTGSNPWVAPLLVRVDDDGASEADGTIMVTLKEEVPTPSTTYTVAGTDNSASVDVIDDDSLPLLTITAPTTGTAESTGIVNFVVSSTKSLGPGSENFRVRYDPSEVSSDFLNENETPTSQEDITSQRIRFTGSGNSFTATLSVPIHKDTVGERTGQIKVSLVADDATTQTYRIATDGTQTAMATIWDDDAPELKIAEDGPVTEGTATHASFTITSQVAVTSLTLNYTPESTNFLERGSGTPTSTPNPLTFSTESPYTTKLLIPIHDDNQVDSAGTIKVTLNEESTPATTYTVAEMPDNSAEVAVTDDESLPVLTITAPTTGIAESATKVDFIIGATIDLGTDFRVRYDPSEVSSNFLDATATPTSQEEVTSQEIDFTGSGGTYTARLSVPLHDDSDGERTGQIQVELLPDDAPAQTYKVATNGTQTVLVTIWDDDAPELLIKSAGDVTEGASANVEFTIEARVIPESPITLYYNVEESTGIIDGDFIVHGEEGDKEKPNINFAGSSEVTLLIPLNDDPNSEGDSTLTVTLRDESGGISNYTVAESPNNAAEVEISDDDSLPELMIANTASGTPESDREVNFTITTTTNPGPSLMIRYNPAEVLTGDFLDATSAENQEEITTKLVNFTTTDGLTWTGTLTVPIHNDDVGENTGKIMVTLLNEEGLTRTYQLGTDDYSALATIWDDDAPELKITAGNPVTETASARAEFKITAEISPNKEVTIRYNLAESANFVAAEHKGNGKTEPLNFTVGKKEATLSIPIINDDDDENNGTITVTLVDDSAPIAYTVAASPGHEAQVDVSDDDGVPTILIEANNGRVAESVGTANFKLTASGLTAAETLTIYATPAEDGHDFLTDTVADTEDDFDIAFSDPDGDTVFTGELSVALDTDNTGEATGTIKLTLNTDNASPRNYDIDPSVSNEGTITILDDDAPELKIMAGNPVTEKDNAVAMFIVSAEVSPNGPVTIHYNLTETEDFIDNEGNDKSESLDFSANKTEAVMSVAITNDTTKEDDGMITVTLITDTAPITYTVAPSPDNVADVNVVDDDGLPTIEIVADNGEVTENAGSAKFKLTATGLTGNTTLIINATPAEDGSDFLADAIADSEANFPVSFELDNNGNFTGELSVDLDDDGDGEATGDIKLTLNADSNTTATYRLGSIIEGVISILDDDAPELTITGGNPVTESDDAVATFTISAKVSPNKPVTIYFTVSEESPNNGTGDFLANTEEGNQNEQLNFSSDATSVDLTIPLVNDDINEDSATISVELMADQNNSGLTYTVSSTQNSSSVEVTDDDLPTIMIEANSGEVAESVSFARFKLAATGLSKTTTLLINATPAEVGHDFLTDAIAGIAADFSVDFSDTDGDNIYTGVLSVSLDNDNMDEENGDIKLTLNAKPRVYNLGSTVEGVITIIDDDIGITQVTIEATTHSPIMEGATAVFTLSVTPANAVSSDLTLDVHFNVTQEGNFILWRYKRSITMDEASKDLEVKTHDDELKEDGGRIIITLVDTEDYDPMAPGFAEIEIMDDDEPDGTQQTAPEDRISVAQLVVNQLLDNPNLYQSPGSTESPAPSPVLPTISIDAVQTSVSEGSSIVFGITANGGSDSNAILVNLNINPIGDFFDFNEPTQISRSMQGQDSVQVTFPTIDDTIAETDGRLEVTIIPDSSYKIASNNGTASVIISDAEDRQLRQDLLSASTHAFLPDVVGNMAARTSSLISQRIQQGFSETKNITLNLGGENTLEGLIEMSGEMTNEGSVEWREVLGDSYFAMALLSGDDFVTPTTIWGIGDNRSLSTSSGSSSQVWSGDVFTGQFGIDALINQEVLTGLSMSITENEIEVGTTSDETLNFTLNSTTITPYFGWTSSNQDADLRANAGYGVGEFTIDQANYDFETLASRSYSFALAGSKELYSSESIFNGSTKLKVIGDSWFARQHVDGKSNLLSNLQTDVQFLRISTEGTHQFAFERGSSLRPLISTGVRRDQKNQQTLFSLELTSGIDYADPIGLTLSGTGSMLLGKETRIQKISLRSSLKYDYGSDNLGLTLEISPTWGQTHTEVENSLWSRGILASDKEIGDYINGTQISSNIGYGFILGENSRKMNLYSGYEFDASTDDELFLGSSISIGPNFGLDLERTNKLGIEGIESTKYQFKARFSW